MKFLSRIRELEAKSPREKYVIVREIGANLMKPFGLNVYDPEFKLNWRSYIGYWVIGFAIICVVYDTAYRQNFKLIEILQIVSFSGIAAHVCMIALKH